MNHKPAIGIGIAAIIAVLCLAALASNSTRIEKSAAVDAEQYADFIENDVFDIQDLAEGAEIQRRRFNRMTPPGVSLIQPMFPLVMPFVAENFDEKFLDELLGEDKNSVEIYPLSLTQDPKTRETLVFNAEGKLIASIPADRISRDWPEDADPARVILQLDLLPSEDVEPYLYTESRIAEYEETQTAKTQKSGGMALRSRGATEFGIAGVQRLNNGNTRVTVTNGTEAAEVFAYTVWHTSSVSVVVWTNEFDEVLTNSHSAWHPVSTPFDGIESAWECLTTNLVLVDGVGVYEDANISSNARVRFYAAAQRMDSDGDGLSDGEEILLRQTDPDNPDSDGDGLLDGHSITVDDADPRYALWASAGLIYADDGELRTFLGELDLGTDPLDSDTDDDGVPDGEDPDPTVPNQEPLIRFLHPRDGQEYLGPANIVLSSDSLYGSEPLSHVVYSIVSESDATTNVIQVSASGNQTTNWYAPPGDFHLLVYGVDGTGQTGETRRVDITVAESESFAILTAAEKQAVLENGPGAVEGVEDWTYSYASVRTGNLPVASSGNRTLSGFINATNYTLIPVTNAYLNAGYANRYLLHADVAYNTPTTNLQATVYGVSRWGARLEMDLPPPPGMLSGGIAVDTMLVFDQNETGEWVGKIYPSLNNVSSNDPSALLHLGYGWERDAFLYRHGSYQTLPGPSAFNGAYDIRLVFGLNNKGLIVGAGFDYDAHSGSPSWTEHYQPLVYRPGQTGSVLAVSSQALGGAAYAVNDKGTIVGCEFMSNALPRAVQWVGGALAPVGGLASATESVAFDVCEEGTVAGMKKVDGQWQGFLANASGSSQFAPSTINGVNFREFWHVGKFGALGWGVSNATQRLFWVFPDDDQDGLSDILEQEIVDADPFDSIVSIADVLGSDDFDGDGLTNAQEWAAKTDPTRKDTDGDRIPDGADPLPLTWRDTDGDGLPDDWETFYGLNPLSTNGMHGASGDPDGDGFTNIEEYRLGSSPTSSAGLGYVFHRGNIGQVQVAIQDSTNCAGNNDSRQFVQRTIQFVEITNANMRPMEFTFRVSVTGRVERQNSGYDLVNVNDELVFGGSNEGMECQMANKSVDVLVKVMAPPGEIALSYDTVDSLFHVGAFARVTDIEMVDVNTNVLSIDIKFADPDDAGWADLEENIVILSDKNTRIKIKITPQLPDLQTIFNDRSTALKIKTSGTAPAGQDYTLTSQNTTLVQGIGYSEVRVSLTRDQLKTLGVLPSQEADSITEKAWLDHGSSSASAPSNLTDGNAFESGLSVETRGKSTHFGNLESSPPNSHIDKTFFIAAGREIITARFGNSVSPKRQIMNQADLFYYSGHGNHADAILQGGFAPIDVTGYWNKDLDCVIVAGCAVLDIKDYRAQSFLPLSWLKWYAAGGDWSPGAQWEPTGPSYLIGYNWTAPLDNQDSSGIISYFLSVLGNGASIVNAWKQANDLGVGRNACVIDCSTNPHVYWYWDETSGPAIWTNVIKSGGSW